MSAPQAEGWTRRHFLGGLTAAGTAGLLGRHPRPIAAEPPPETSTLRIGQSPAICFAPPYVAAEQLFQAEGIVDVQYVKRPLAFETIASGETDFAASDVGTIIASLDKGEPIVVLVGLHSGCYELFVASMAAYVGLDPRKDIHWVFHPQDDAPRLLVEGTIDAFLVFPPFAQELRARQIAHVVVDSSKDRPWSQYFCCMVVAHREFVRKHPVATKRAVRAILKAADLCALAPERVARLLVDKAYASRYDVALQAMQEVPYGQWWEYDPEDTVRFYALRLHEAGMLKSSPQKLIAQGTDWRFLNELKRELKG